MRVVFMKILFLIIFIFTINCNSSEFTKCAVVDKQIQELCVFKEVSLICKEDKTCIDYFYRLEGNNK